MISETLDPEVVPSREISFEANPAQEKLFHAITSGMYDRVIAAGTISSSKTFGVLAALVAICRIWPGTQVVIVRSNRPTLRDVTLPDLQALLPSDFIKQFNRSTFDFRLKNGSHIALRPALESLDKGGLKTWKGAKPDFVFFNEVDSMGKAFVDFASSRVFVPKKDKGPMITGRPKCVIMDCNPNNSWVKAYYDLHIHNPAKLDEEKVYFQIFSIEDNAKYINQEKIAAWKRTFSPAQYKRFVKGDWRAMVDREQLIPFEYVDQCKPFIPPEIDSIGQVIKPFRYMGVDPARYGSDKCVFVILDGPNLLKIEYFDQTSIPDIELHTVKLMGEYGILPENICVDVGGLGAGVVDNLEARSIFVNAFNGASAPLPVMRSYHFSFHNLRAQAYWVLMELLRDKKLGNLGTMGTDDRGLPIDTVMEQDLTSIHYGSPSNNSKAIKIEAKEEIKARLGRSPDFGDAFCYAACAMAPDFFQRKIGFM